MSASIHCHFRNLASSSSKRNGTGYRGNKRPSSVIAAMQDVSTYPLLGDGYVLQSTNKRVLWNCRAIEPLIPAPDDPSCNPDFWLNYVDALSGGRSFRIKHHA